MLPLDSFKPKGDFFGAVLLLERRPFEMQACARLWSFRRDSKWLSLLSKSASAVDRRLFLEALGDWNTHSCLCLTHAAHG